MKNILCSLLLLAISINLQSQTNLIIDPSFNCLNCFGDYDINTGNKYQFNVGLVKNISPKLDLVSNLGFGVWRYKRQLKDFSGNVVDDVKQKRFFFEFSIGERYHLFKFKTASIYTGLNINLQLYTSSRINNQFGLSVEPTIGWKKSIGEKVELFVQGGFDQQINNYTDFFAQRPGRLACDFGFNLILKNKKEETIE